MFDLVDAFAIVKRVPTIRKHACLRSTLYHVVQSIQDLTLIHLRLHRLCHTRKATTHHFRPTNNLNFSGDVEHERCRT